MLAVLIFINLIVVALCIQSSHFLSDEESGQGANSVTIHRKEAMVLTPDGAATEDDSTGSDKGESVMSIRADGVTTVVKGTKQASALGMGPAHCFGFVCPDGSVQKHKLVDESCPGGNCTEAFCCQEEGKCSSFKCPPGSSPSGANGCGPLPCSDYTCCVEGSNTKATLNGGAEDNTTSASGGNVGAGGDNTTSTGGGNGGAGGSSPEVPNTTSTGGGNGGAGGSSPEVATCSAALALLPSGDCIDKSAQKLIPCTAEDATAWTSVKSSCAKRSLLLCTNEQYKFAYANKEAYNISDLKDPSKFGWTSTTTGCPSNTSIVMSDQDGSEHGCHSNKGCFPDRYFRCCDSKALRDAYALQFQNP